MGMLVLNWQKKLGYKGDPFEDTPFYKKQFVGLKSARERLNLFIIKRERFGTIRGASGLGKSTLLRWLEAELKESSKISVKLFDASKIRSREKLFAELYNWVLTIIEKVQRIQQKRSVEEKENLLRERLTKEPHLLLIDNAGALSNTQTALLIELLNKTKVQVLLADEHENLKGLPGKPTLKLQLKKYREKDLTEMLKQRIESCNSVGLFPFDEKELKKVFKKADGNPAVLFVAARERAIELSLKGLPLPEKEKQPIKLFGKEIKLHELATKMKSDAKGTTGKGGAKGKGKKGARKKWGIFTIEYDDKKSEKEAAEAKPDDDDYYAPAPATSSATSQPLKKSAQKTAVGGSRVVRESRVKTDLPPEAAEDAEALASLIESSGAGDTVEIEVEEGPAEIIVTEEALDEVEIDAGGSRNKKKKHK